MDNNTYDIVSHASSSEIEAQKVLTQMLLSSPIPRNEILSNLGLFLTSKSFSRLLFFYELYKQVVQLHGVIMDFGTRYGQTAAILSTLRAIFEPYNRIRKVVAFDTFNGLKGIGSQDTGDNKCTDGAYSLPLGYESYLDALLNVQERLDPISHIVKHEVVKGDVTETLPSYFRSHPETIVSLAVFDMDIYKPTLHALKDIKPYLCRGSILVFDELCDNVFPGETAALREVLEVEKLYVRRMPMTSRLSYIVYE